MGILPRWLIAGQSVFSLQFYAYGAHVLGGGRHPAPGCSAFGLLFMWSLHMHCRPHADYRACVCAVFIHVLGSFQVYTVPVFDMLEVQLLKRGIDNTFICRLIYRSIYVTLVTFVAVRKPVRPGQGLHRFVVTCAAIFPGLKTAICFCQSSTSPSTKVEVASSDFCLPRNLMFPVVSADHVPLLW